MKDKPLDRRPRPQRAGYSTESHHGSYLGIGVTDDLGLARGLRSDITPIRRRVPSDLPVGPLTIDFRGKSLSGT